MSSHSPSRWLAPVALAAAAVAVLLVVGGGGPETSESGSQPRPSATRTSGASTTSSRPRSSRPRRYTVRSGDVLSAIAERYGTTVDALLRLNPDIDVRGLRPGQRLKLRR